MLCCGFFGSWIGFCICLELKVWIGVLGLVYRFLCYCVCLVLGLVGICWCWLVVLGDGCGFCSVNGCRLFCSFSCCCWFGCVCLCWMIMSFLGIGWYCVVGYWFFLVWSGGISFLGFCCFGCRSSCVMMFRLVCVCCCRCVCCLWWYWWIGWWFCWGGRLLGYSCWGFVFWFVLFSSWSWFCCCCSISLGVGCWYGICCCYKCLMLCCSCLCLDWCCGWWWCCDGRWLLLFVVFCWLDYCLVNLWSCVGVCGLFCVYWIWSWIVYFNVCWNCCLLFVCVGCYFCFVGCCWCVCWCLCF